MNPTVDPSMEELTEVQAFDLAGEYEPQSVFSTQQQMMLAEYLKRDRIKVREQAGMKLAYLEGWDVIETCNRIFGFGNWDNEIVHHEIVSLDEVDGKWRVSYVTTARLTLRGPGGSCVHDGVGDGEGIAKSKHQAITGGSKEAATDALKRALIHMGNQFGLCLYDKDKAGVEPRT